MQHRISSSANKIFKNCQKLAGNKKYRDAGGMFLIEGENLLVEAFASKLEVESIIVSALSKYAFDSAGDKENGDVDYLSLFGEKLLERLDEDAKHDFENALSSAVCFDGELFSKLKSTETSQGIMAVVKKPSYSYEEVLESVKVGENVLVLDRLQDSGNIGTLIRTAEASGYSLIVFMKGTVDAYSPKVLRAAAGSAFRQKMITLNDNASLLDLISRLGKKLAVTVVDGGKPYYEAELSHDIVLVIGNEGNGVSQELAEKATVNVTIPMRGKLESLNAAVAAAILMYEAVRQG